MSTPKPLQKKALYRFLPARFALMAIETKELRVGRLSELNDPFELIPASSRPLSNSHRNIEQNNIFLKAADVDFGIICFSTAPEDPVVWSHYSDGHKGIALCFEYELNDTVFEVEYPPSNLRPVLDEDFFKELKGEGQAREALMNVLKTKAPSWKYEKEYRVFPALDSCIPRNGMYFQPFEKAKLKQIIPGSRCSISDRYLEHAVKASGLEASIQRADINEKHFTVGCRLVKPATRNVEKK